MAEKTINPTLKQILELGPTVAFFLMYLRLRDQVFTFAGEEYSGFIVATLVFVPILLLAMGALWFLTGKLSRLQIFTAFMVIVFGGLTAYFNDERFFKMKTTIVYGVFAILLGFGLLMRRSYLEWVMGDMIPMEHEGWMKFTQRLCGAFLVLAIANEVIWRSLSTDAWVKIETFGFPIALFGFMMWQIMALQPYMIEQDTDEDTGKNTGENTGND